MLLLHPKDIPTLDQYAASVCGLPTQTLMARAGEAVARQVRRLVPVGGRVAFFCGSGNNGGDGYAAALSLHRDGYDVVLLDVFGKGQRTEEGCFFYESCCQQIGAPRQLSDWTDDELRALLQTCSGAVDAMFGTGLRTDAPLPAEGVRVARLVRQMPLHCVAVDIPFGVDGDGGEVAADAWPADVTVCLTACKVGLLSYPAREMCGQIVTDTLDISPDAAARCGALLDTTGVDAETVRPWFAPRLPNTHKGSFGKLLAVVGSDGYRGAAALAAEGVLRTGVGLLTLASEGSVVAGISGRLPECVLMPLPPSPTWNDGDVARILQVAKEQTALLVGCGCGRSRGVLRLLRHLLATEGCPLVVDADGINLLAEERAESIRLLQQARRAVVLTPHPLEFSRISGEPCDKVQQSRLTAARRFAEKIGAVIVLKGAGTVTVDGREGRTYINTTGSPALAKGGSGDVLAGVIASLIAQGMPAAEAAAAGVYLHGKAGDALAEVYSDRGVLPSELPRQLAREIAELQRGQ